MRVAFCEDWSFWPEGEKRREKVTLPHGFRRTPVTYAEAEDDQLVGIYEKTFYAPKKWREQRLFLVFEGAAHRTEVSVNGRKAADHACGYTGFRAEITGLLRFGEDNTVTVRVDSRETLDQPPFGGEIDYLTYGGLYRNVWLELREPVFLSDAFVYTMGTDLHARLTASGPEAEGETLVVTVQDADGKTLARQVTAFSRELTLPVPEAKLWTPEEPNLYTATFTLGDDALSVRFGFRTVEFRGDGFYLNGQRRILRGLNRHQSFPILGYAAPDALQRMDADILRYELGLDVVRTSHYPQARSFLDRCDENGLLVFTEIPGWQHVGGAAWRAQAVRNVSDMVSQNRNHPCIIAWGVRINESPDCHDFYMETNKAARELDPTRPTGGVRNFPKSELLEDVYTVNDFSPEDHTRVTFRPKAMMTPDGTKGYLVTEFGGHMFPTKTFDDETHRVEHALRHARLVSETRRLGDRAGCIGWCAFDYQTHREFGSGDRVCYHGVMDQFRNPKPAADFYASQQEDRPVLRVASALEPGDLPGYVQRQIWVFTNADSVRLYRNGEFVSETFPDKKAFPGLAHPPVEITDLVGERILRDTGYDEKTAARISDWINRSRHLYGGPEGPAAQRELGLLCLAKGLSRKELTDLYWRYSGGWTGAEFRFDAVKDGQVVRSVTKRPGTAPALWCQADHTELKPGTGDVALVRIRAVDAAGDPASYFQEPVTLRAEGCLEILGPSLVLLPGGCGGAFLRPTGEGEGTLTVSHPRLGDVKLAFTADV